MIIEKIVIKSFGRLNEMTLEFSDRVNVIEGENESGKSTIAAFIRYMPAHNAMFTGSQYPA